VVPDVASALKAGQRRAITLSVTRSRYVPDRPTLKDIRLALEGITWPHISLAKCYAMEHNVADTRKSIRTYVRTYVRILPQERLDTQLYT
jgi:hypothetical protein